MNEKRYWLVTLILALAMAAPINSARAAQSDDAAVKQAAANFYSALNVFFTGDLTPMTKVWSHADDVTYMGPGGGFEVGWKNVLPQWQKQAKMKLGGKITPERMHLIVGREIAVVQDIEVGENTNAPGKPAKVSIRATSIFRKEHGKWKMISHHTDLLPYLSK
jgi:ketosteroid isomerase-like protein